MISEATGTARPIAPRISFWAVPVGSEIKTFQRRRVQCPSAAVLSSLRSYSTLLPQAPGRLPEVRLAGPCHGNSTPARISRGRPPCMIPVYRGLGRDGSIRRHGSWRNSLPWAAFGTGGTAGHLDWPSFMRVTPHRWSWRTLPRRSPLPGTCSGSDIRFSKSRWGAKDNPLTTKPSS